MIGSFVRRYRFSSGKLGRRPGWHAFAAPITKRTRARAVRAAKAWHPCLEELESRLAPSVNVLSYRNNLASTGLNANETQLTPSNVAVGSFGKLFATSVDGQVYAEPL